MRYADYLEGTGTKNLIFRYIVQAGDHDHDGIVIGALELNGGSIDNELGDATLTLNNIGSTESILVDAVVPTVTNVSVPPSGTYGPGQGLTFTASFSETVMVTGTPQIAIAVGSSTAYAKYVSGSGTANLTFLYTVEAGQADHDGIAVWDLSLNGGTIQDAAGNDAVLTLNNVGSTAGILVDGVGPDAPSIALSPSSDTGMSSSDGITNDTTPTLRGTAEAGSTVSLYEGTSLVGTTVADTSGNWSMTLSGLSEGVHSFVAKAKDASGNESAASAVLNITVDTQAPSLSVLPADGAIDIALYGNIVLTFSEGMDTITPGTVQLDGTHYAGTWSAGNTIYTIPYSGLIALKNYSFTVAGFRDVAGNVMAAAVTSSFTTGAPASGGGGYTQRVVTDHSSGLTVSGRLSRGAALRVVSFTPARNTTDPALAAIVKRMDSLEDTLIFCADISISGNYSGPLTLSFEVGSQYNGQTVTLLHVKDGKILTYTAVVVDGIATFTVESLSPFALFAPVTALNVLDIPKTGDSGMLYGVIVLGMAALIACIAVMQNRRQYKKAK